MQGRKTLLDPRRRELLRGGALAMAGLLLGGPASVFGNPSGRRFTHKTKLAVTDPELFEKELKTLKSAPPRSLALLHTHTGETLEAVYWENGTYQPEALTGIDHLLRDFRTGESKEIDCGLLDLLHSLRSKIEATRPFHVISGYRSPNTNQMLREKSKAVASHSLHMVGKAIDIRLPGVDLRKVRDAALYLARGGVGYYPSSDFVHVDTGRVRTW